MKGTSYTYFTTDNAKQARELIGILRESKSEVPPELEQMAMFSGGGGAGRSSSLFTFAFLIISYFFQAVTVPAVGAVEAEVGVDAVVAAGAGITVVGTGVVGAGVVVGVTVVAAEDAIGGELRSTASIRLILYNLPRFGSAIDQP